MRSWRRSAFLGLAVVCTAQPSIAYDSSPCDGVVEQGMRVQELNHLGFRSGFTIEQYWHVRTGQNPPTAPVAALDKFFGVRIMECSTGRFIAIDGNPDAGEVDAALSSTEFLRGKVQSEQTFNYDDVRQAGEAVFGDLVLLRENEESCGCADLYPELRPAGLVPFADRDNVTHE
jgi:hypothetical protein